MVLYILKCNKSFVTKISWLSSWFIYIYHHDLSIFICQILKKDEKGTKYIGS